MALNEYESLLSQLEAIDEKLVIEPTIPVAIMLQESADLYEWCQADKEILMKAGLDWSLVTSMPTRTSSCRYAQSQWQKESKTQQESQKEWILKSPVAFELRDELVHHSYHAFYKLPDLYAKAQKIAEGSGSADMIQDLSDLNLLGLGNSDAFAKIGVNMDLFVKAGAMSEEMAALLAKVNGSKQAGNKSKLMRDKAYTYVKQAADEIRRNGQYAFYRNEDRKKGYVSKFLKKKSSNNGNNSKPKDETNNTNA